MTAPIITMATTIQLKKNLCVLYPGGTGGNHLANLISLCEGFSSRFTSNNYAIDLLQMYKEMPVPFIDEKDKLLLVTGLKAHFGDESGFSRLLKSEPPGSEQITVANGHIGDLYGVLKSAPNVFADSVWLVIPSPADKNSIVYKRILASEYFPIKDERYTLPFADLINTDNGILFDSELFCSETGVDYLRTLLLDVFNVTLPDTANEIHGIWFNWMKTAQEAYDRVNNIQS